MASCFLPQVVRVATASQQHYGVSMTRGLRQEPLPGGSPEAQFSAELKAELEPHNAALAGDPRDAAALLARAAIFEKSKMPANALAEYRKAAAEWQEAVWIRGKIFELEEELASAQAAQSAEAAGGKTLALLVGVSKYQKLPQDLWLQFAHADAAAFEKYFLSPRGGGLPPENILALTDEKATTAALRNGFQTFLKTRAEKKDTVFVLLAGHAVVEFPGRREAYVLSHDSDPQDLSATAVSMTEIQTLVQEQLSNAGRVIVFADVCRAGQLGSIKNASVNSNVEKLGESEGDLFGFMASRPREVSYEGPQFGGGHGAFSYYLLKALNGEADRDGNKIVNVNELIDYVRTKVAQGTDDKQHPRDFGVLDNAVPLSDASKPGIQLTHWPVIFDSHGGPMYLASAGAPQAGQLSSSTQTALDRFSDALARGRLLPSEKDNAFDALRELKSRLSPEQYLVQENRLRVALEDRGQQVLLKYLAGDEEPQNRQDFLAGARYMEAATALTPESLYLEGRKSFFDGRALLFDKKYAEASKLLEDSVRIDPNGAYAYNALGISYLEQADYRRAISAFRDASRLAVHWVYPLHNLALAYVETGNYSAAIQTYRQAMRIRPEASYLPYNLGLVYQRLNKSKDAEAAYRKAISLGPNAAEPYNALGSLYASRRKTPEAERQYRTALEKNPGMLAARHNLGLLLWEQKTQFDEAARLWRANLADAPDYLPSRLGLAEALAARGQTQPAIQEYSEIVRRKPDYLAARLTLADLHVKDGQAERAAAELNEVLRLDPNNTAAYEKLGDLESSRGRRQEAAAAYQQALERTTDSAARKHLRSKLNGAAGK